MKRAVQWSLGCNEVRQARPPSSSTAVIWFQVDDRGDPARELGSLCTGGPAPGTEPAPAPATSMLPDRDSGRVYLVISGKLYVMDRDAGATTPVAMKDTGRWRFSRLLGLARSSGPLTVLAEMIDPHQATQLWLFTVTGTSAHGAPLPPDHASLRDAQAFKAEFVLPRCLDGYARCLVVMHPRGLGREPRGQARDPVTLPGATETARMVIVDGAWSLSQERAMLVLAQDRSCAGPRGARVTEQP